MSRTRVFCVLFLIGFFSSSVFSHHNIEVTKVGEWGTSHYCDVFVQGNYAYCATSFAGLDIIDINTPANPVIVGHYKMMGEATGVWVSNNYAYMACGDGGLYIIDISNPASPKFVGYYNTFGEVIDVYVSGDYAYLADGFRGLQVINVSNPASPTLSGYYDTAGYAYGVFVSGKYAYVGDGTNGLRVIDISNPSSPTLAGSFDTDGVTYRLDVVGNYLYAADGNGGLKIFDISNPASPLLVGNYNLSIYRSACDVDVIGNYAYVAYEIPGLYVIDISNPTSPQLVGIYDTEGSARGVYVKENHAYVADYQGGLQILDVSVPASPKLAGNYNASGSARGVYVKGNYAYVAHGEGGLRVLDVSDPSSPTLTGSYHSFGSIMGVHAKGNYAYVADYGQSSFKVIDVSNPSSPALSGSCDTPGNPEKVYVNGSYAYVADDYRGLQIVDISTPVSPRLIGNYDTPGYAKGAYVKGNYAYVADYYSLQVLDISNPSSPTLVGTCDALEDAWDVYVNGDYAYVADGVSGLKIIDVSNPASLNLVGYNHTPEFAQAVHVSGNYAYVADYDKGLKAFDISEPSFPRMAWSNYTPGNARDIYVNGDYLYAADGDSGKVLIYKITDIFTLDVYSSPNTGVPITVSPNDKDGNGDGNTFFYRTYYQGTQVTLTAQTIYNGARFLKWTIDGADDANSSIRVTMDSDHTVTAVYQGAPFPQIWLNRTYMNFGAVRFGLATGSQILFIDNTGGGILNWSAAADQSWLQCTPSMGTGPGSVTISIDAAGLSAGTYPGTVTISVPNATNSPQTVSVTLDVYDPYESSIPFGTFETPTDGAAVRSSIPVTGWVLDDIGVKNVTIYRGEVGNLIYIGDAVLVEGARPDVEQAYPGYPMNYKAGWGYMMLTNFLPNGGNGTYTIHATAVDLEGNVVLLGTKTITVDNVKAVKPFGAIDTPTQGGMASGSSFINWGWVLTPQPNSIPTDGSTINVFVDGLNLGHPTYNIYRTDIAGLFPGYNNSDGAVGYLYLDTTSFKNGVHTIQWVAADDAGNTDGIGSRYFTIQNAGESRAAASDVQSLRFDVVLDRSQTPVDHPGAVRIRTGYDNNEPYEIYPDEKGIISIEIKELERLEIRFFDEENSTLKNITPLPLGSTLDAEQGIFYWSPGPGFVGNYRLVFIETDLHGNMTRKDIMISIQPKF
jgi:hypothetical protein